MTTYTTEELERGVGTFFDRPTRAVSWDGGTTWSTMDLSTHPGGEPTDVLTIPAGGTLDDGV